MYKIIEAFAPSPSYPPTCPGGIQRRTKGDELGKYSKENVLPLINYTYIFAIERNLIVTVLPPIGIISIHTHYYY